MDEPEPWPWLENRIMLHLAGGARVTATSGDTVTLAIPDERKVILAKPHFDRAKARWDAGERPVLQQKPVALPPARVASRSRPPPNRKG